MDNNQFEGLCSLSAVKGSSAFFNSLQVLQRDLSVLALRVHLANSQGRTAGLPNVKPSSDASCKSSNSGSTGTGSARVLDAMCGGGVRAVRYALEGGPHVQSCVAVDLNPQSVATAKLTVAHSGPRATERVEVRIPSTSKLRSTCISMWLAEPLVRHGDCNTVMAAASRGSSRFEVLDLDPCGSPAPFLDRAVRAVATGGLLCVASTEDPALDPILCAARYGGRCFGRDAARVVGAACHAEVQIRLLLARIDAAARAANRRATPLLSLHLDFFRRVYVRIDDASASSHAPSSTASDQSPLVTVRAIQPTATASACGGPAWEVVHSKQGATRADGSGASVDGWEAGPMWSGPLHDQAFAEQCWAQVRERDDAAQSSSTPQSAKRARKVASSAVHNSNKSTEVAGASAPPFRSLPRLRALLRLVAAEASTNKPNNLLLCYEPAGRGNKGALSGAAWKAVVKNLTGKGYLAAVSHCDPSCGLKTNAPWQMAVDACEAAREKVSDSSSSSTSTTSSGGENSGRAHSKKANASSSRLIVLPALPDPVAVGISASAAAATYEASLATQIASRAHSSWASSTTSTSAAANDLTWQPAPLAADANSAGAVGGGAPPPRGLPAHLVNASALDAPALRAAIADLLQSSPHLQVPPGAGAFWQPADFSGGSGFAAGSDASGTGGGGKYGQDEEDDESSVALARKARLKGQVGQVIIVGQGAKAAVKAGAGLHVAELVQHYALQEFSCGGAHGGKLGSAEEEEEMKSDEAAAVAMMDYTLPWRAELDLKPLEYAETLAEGITKLKPYGVLVLRAQRHDPSMMMPSASAAAAAVGAPTGFPTLTAEGCLLLGDDQWGAVILGAQNKHSSGGNISSNRSSNPEKSHPSSKPNAQQQSAAAGGPGGSGVDTLVCAAPGVALCGLVIEAPPPPLQGHALAVSGGCSSCTLEGCLLRGPTSLLQAPASSPSLSGGVKNTAVSNEASSAKVVPWSDGQSYGSSSRSSGGNKAKKRKQQHGWSGGGGSASDGKATVRGCCCAADGALLLLLRCHVRGGHGERSRALVAAAAQAAAAKASTSSPFASSSSSLQYISASALLPGMTSLIKPSSAAIEMAPPPSAGGGGAGLAIGGAGVFVVGKAVADVEDSLIDGCRGPGLEARRGGSVVVRSGGFGGGGCSVSYCNGPGLLVHQHGRALLQGPGVEVRHCAGEAAIEVGAHGQLDVDGLSGGGGGMSEAGGVAVVGARGHGLLCHAGGSATVRGLRVDRSAGHGTLARGEGTALSLTAGCLFTRCRLAALSVADGAELALGTGNAVVSNNEGLDYGSSAVLVSTGGRVIDENQG